MSTHGETLRKWLAKRIPGDLCGLQLGEDWNRVTMVNRVDTRAGTINTVARIDHADAAEAMATACLFSVAPALAEEVLLLRERTKKAEAERDAMRAAVREYIAADDAWGAAADQGEDPMEPERVKRARKRLGELSREGGR